MPRPGHYTGDVTINLTSANTGTGQVPPAGSKAAASGASSIPNRMGALKDAVGGLLNPANDLGQAMQGAASA